jgi:hypothetical protein
VVHRLRARRPAADRARGAGRERRLRCAGGGAHRPHGARLVPAGQEGRGPVAGSAAARRPSSNSSAGCGKR